MTLVDYFIYLRVRQKWRVLVWEGMAFLKVPYGTRKLHHKIYYKNDD
jgi:hypothetical protein